MTNRKAYRIDDGTEIRPGEPVTDFRGEVHTLTYLSRANDEFRDGLVVLDNGREYYARVVGLRIAEET